MKISRNYEQIIFNWSQKKLNNIHKEKIKNITILRGKTNNSPYTRKLDKDRFYLNANFDYIGKYSALFANTPATLDFDFTSGNNKIECTFEIFYGGPVLSVLSKSTTPDHGIVFYKPDSNNDLWCEQFIVMS